MKQIKTIIIKEPIVSQSDIDGTMFSDICDNINNDKTSSRLLFKGGFRTSIQDVFRDYAFDFVDLDMFFPKVRVTIRSHVKKIYPVRDITLNYENVTVKDMFNMILKDVNYTNDLMFSFICQILSDVTVSENDPNPERADETVWSVLIGFMDKDFNK